MLKKKIDALPQGGEWFHEIIEVVGDRTDEDGKPMTEELELWRRDPVECVRELIANPTFKGHMAYAPERVFEDEEALCRILEEMWTGNWWWKTQVSSRWSHLWQKKSYRLFRTSFPRAQLLPRSSLHLTKQN